ncbi:hypothetical protein M2451_001764 [Dysgonomonas sp. PFB1-18]|uniref:DUF3467 domain-containing protein n=1 Tax=unclassified Dysgonomonas TaxID=2630389 RepID=UPI002475A78E|nr:MULTISPECIES: DUF3467 domain-containing protein [unclassified Dysgonomonas]MDH6309193.1 hypothetical protein [Dysgonomonas sp. PF1-14]MDH6338927.1 hypothetical protein [Dysgonomonas sp. PF1-16]MDH6380442.1 hypothetical protein [Dysgonomonas sp. PFB1-18]MDH6397755.1 hypothetical protein [Dysgonomonas sp. PF1-23]
MENNNEQEGQIQIELPEDVAQGTYSNLAIIAHSSSEFVIDFVRILPGLPKAKVKSRIILTPEHAKRLLFALNENINRYEAQYGQVSADNSPGFLPPINGSIGEA